MKDNDPFVNHFIKVKNISEKIKKINIPYQFYESEIFHEKLVATQEFIGWGIANKIRYIPEPDGYEAFSKILICLRNKNKKFHILTTNYDQNIENIAANLGLNLDDGFSSRKVRASNGDRWEVGYRFRFFKSRKPNLIKLHGSINWFLCDNPLLADNYIVGKHNELIHPLDAAFSRILVDDTAYTPCYAPWMLRGSITKTESYFKDINISLQKGLYQFLDKIDVLVVSGFGFSDVALSKLILDFAYEPRKSLLILDGSESPAIYTIPNMSIEERVGPLDSRKPIVLLSSFLSEVDIDVLKEHITTLHKRVSNG
ncbi:SIR2 family protein [Salinimonas chungwhensis]|uniref:SIR2 family protein n=1 Tax=Salinimonas chungwhensis TaxID=265425 RepID=UPI00035D96B6|nr:SIR2 family protein [Salinimonas chungwhensis]